ncbi:acyl-CoA N-acyltransferase, partial [Filobasidium floriforme]|uniref:acyl-CoA N-acyltransferase n=1 Tax=Filobasidium floriforme TaxID=5210 RepID=UPI001E8CF539
HQRAEFIISLRPAFHGKGFGTKAVNWLVTVGFQRANLHRIEGSYNMGNIPAEKCYKKLGFKIEGVWRKHTWADGEWVDIVNM